MAKERPAALPPAGVPPGDGEEGEHPAPTPMDHANDPHRLVYGQPPPGAVECTHPEAAREDDEAHTTMHVMRQPTAQSNRGRPRGPGATVARRPVPMPRSAHELEERGGAAEPPRAVMREEMS